MGQCASDTTDLLFTNCRVPASRMLGPEGEEFVIAMSGLDARISIIYEGTSQIHRIVIANELTGKNKRKN